MALPLHLFLQNISFLCKTDKSANYKILHNNRQKTKNRYMIDIKSRLVLSNLAKECSDGSYHVVEVPDIIMALPKRYRMDSDAVKHILTHLERQDIISIKYDDDDVFCLAVLPYGFEILETEKTKKVKAQKSKTPINFATVFLSFFAALVGTAIGIVVCYFLLK